MWHTQHTFIYEVFSTLNNTVLPWYQGDERMLTKKLKCQHVGWLLLDAHWKHIRVQAHKKRKPEKTSRTRVPLIYSIFKVVLHICIFNIKLVQTDFLSFAVFWSAWNVCLDKKQKHRIFVCALKSNLRKNLMWWTKKDLKFIIGTSAIFDGPNFAYLCINNYLHTMTLSDGFGVD